MKNEKENTCSYEKNVNDNLRKEIDKRLENETNIKKEYESFKEKYLEKIQQL